MGDAVNLAQRIQGANRGFGTDILAAAATARHSGEHIEWRAVSATVVPGRREAVSLFKPVGLKRGKWPELHDGGLIDSVKPLKER